MEYERVIPCDILDDLCSRFIINVPDEERRDLIRICFQIESAHWFYIDFYSKNFPTKKPCGIKEFAQQIFKHLPFLQPYANNVEKIIDDWKDYKFCVPTFGAILLDEDLSHVLLVQSYCSRSSWGFPKGKVNKDEPPYQCAIREVYEETGFDISNLINANEYIEANVNDQVVRLYLIPGINKQEKFEPKTRNEIKAVNWFPICDIPSNKKEASLKLGTGANTFFLVSPFLRRLRQWIFDHNRRLPLKYFQRQRHKSCSDIDVIRYRSSTMNLKESVAMLKSFKDKRGDHVSDTLGSSYEVDSDKAGEKSQISILQPCHLKNSSDSLLISTGSGYMNQSSCVEQVFLDQSKLSKYSAYVNPLQSEKVLLDQSKLKKYRGYVNPLLQSDDKIVCLRNRKFFYDNFSNNVINQPDYGTASASSQSLIPVNYSHSNANFPLKQDVEIVSHESAFRKVEKSAKNKKRNRGKKLVKQTKCEEVNLFYSDVYWENSIKNSNSLNNAVPENIEKSSSVDNCKVIVPSSNEKGSFLEEQPLLCVSRWMNFKFDLNAILRSMEDAVVSKKTIHS